MGDKNRRTADALWSAIQSNPTASLLLDEDGCFVVANAAWLGSDLIKPTRGQPLSALMSASSAAGLAKFVKNQPAGSAKPDHFPTQLDGETGAQKVKIVRLQDEGEACGGFVVYALNQHDTVSDRRNLTVQQDLRWQTALECAEQAVWDSGARGGVTFVSDNWFKLRGWDDPDTHQAQLENWMDRVHPDDLPHVLDCHRQQDLGEIDVVDYQYRYRHADNHWIWIHSRGRILSRLDDGTPDRVVGTDSDVTAFQRIKDRSRELAETYELSLEASGIGTWRFILEADTAFWDARMLSIYGITDGKNTRPRNEWGDLLHPDDAADAQAAAEACLRNGDGFNQEYRIVRMDGAMRYVRSTAKCTRDAQNRITGLIGVSFDITNEVRKTQALEAARAALEHDSRHDPLTGLANRRRLEEYHAGLADHAKENGVGLRFAVMHMDLDHFKQINDTFGHAAGDALLIHVAKILRATLSHPGLIARVGGDEFVVILDGCVPDAVIDQITTDIHRATQHPFHYGGKTARWGISIGIAHQRADDQTGTDALIEADQALYQAKAAGRNCAYASAVGLRKQAEAPPFGDRLS